MKKESKSKVQRLWGYLRPYWRLEAMLFLVLVATSALVLALPLAVKYMIDDLIPSLIASGTTGVDVKPVVYFGLVLTAIYFLYVGFGWVRDYLAGYIGANIIADMRSELFEHLEYTSLRFYQKHEIGEVMSRLLSDVTRVQSLLTTTFLMALNNVLMLVVMLGYLLSVNWLLTAVALVPVPLTILLSRRFGRKLNRIARRLQESIAGFSARLQEAFLSIRTIKAFNQEQSEKKRVDNLLRDLTRVYISNSVTNSLAVNLVYFVNMLGPVVVLAWGTYLVAKGTFQLGELIAFYLLLTYLYSPIRDLASVNIEVQSAMASVDRIFEYLDIPLMVVEIDSPVDQRHVAGELEFRRVEFRYEDSSFRFGELTLHIGAGEKVAVVGPSGSGKTTLVNLIMRFFDPGAGEILLDGVDLKRLSLRSLRRHIALVDQDPVLFKATVAENIAYGSPGLSKAHIESAARSANIHDFIAGLPDGYETVVGERGVTLSGGEKQRICLARAVLRDPAVFLLDEATSALDSNSEQLIQESLAMILANKTAIIIAHRFSTIQHADRIVVLDGGKVVGQGTQEALLAESPLFRELAEKQLMQVGRPETT